MIPNIAFALSNTVHKALVRRYDLGSASAEAHGISLGHLEPSTAKLDLLGPYLFSKHRLIKYGLDSHHRLCHGSTHYLHSRFREDVESSPPYRSGRLQVRPYMQVSVTTSSLAITWKFRLATLRHLTVALHYRARLRWNEKPTWEIATRGQGSDPEDGEIRTRIS